MSWIRLASLLIRGRARVVVSGTSAGSGISRSPKPPEESGLQAGRAHRPVVAPLVRTYYVDSPAAALSRAVRELGPEALLLSARKAAEGTQERGVYEVVCGIAEQPVDSFSADLNGKGVPSTTEPAVPQGTGSFAKLIEGLFSPAPARVESKGESASPVMLAGSTGPQAKPQEKQSGRAEPKRRASTPFRFRKELISLRAAGLEESPARREPPLVAQPEVVQQPRSEALDLLQADIRTKLVRQGLSDRIALSVTERAAAGLDSAVRTSDSRVERALWDAVRREMLGRIRTDVSLGNENGRPHLVMLVGPPRCGKSITLLKLASLARCAGVDAVRLLFLQPSQIQGGPALRWADRFGLPWQPVSDVTALERALAGVNSGLVLIDTPGLPAGDLAGMEPLSRFLDAHRKIDVHLTLPLTLRDQELARQVDLAEVLRPNKLLFTMLDRAEAWGTVFREACRTGKALSFFGNGRSIPQGSLPACAEDVVDPILTACTCPMAREDPARADGLLIQSR
jgi:flagellar biosynthesis GTPase FlhF